MSHEQAPARRQPKALRDGRRRAIIDNVYPQVDNGIFPIKRILGDTVDVEADIYTDGHDLLSADLIYRHETDETWSRQAMTPLVNDRWQGGFQVTQLGVYDYTIEAWINHFETWRQGLIKKIEADQDVAVDVLVGAKLIEKASKHAVYDNKKQLKSFAKSFKSTLPNEAILLLCNDDVLIRLMRHYVDHQFMSLYPITLKIVVDREKARFSTWYELFPRSTAPHPDMHGTFRDCISFLPYIRNMGFDVVYFPPIHPIGTAYRKGRNHALAAQPDDPGSPWAIGSPDGGHKSIHPQLGTLEEFQELLRQAQTHGIEIALDIAFQCSPDHPYVKSHPQWFAHRPDGSIQYAENPPKKYQDIYPFDFESKDWAALWQELKSIFLFWIENGIRIFRVDNPHTKPFRFWAWLIPEIKHEYPEVIFLSEAFTRPKPMYYLAKLGFSQSYNYFPWRIYKHELVHYLTELTQPLIRDFFRPNLWPNTPDILHDYLQKGGRPAFMIRLVLAATLGASYGIYGPAFELCENDPFKPGSEEYFNSEKYEFKHWDIHAATSLSPFIARINDIRRLHPALQYNDSLRFHPIDNEEMICYSKQAPDGLSPNLILAVVNLDPFHSQSGWVELPLDRLGISPHTRYTVYDLMSYETYYWTGSRNYVALDPKIMPAHIFEVKL